MRSYCFSASDMTENAQKSTCLTRKHPCPCGDDQCYVNEEGYEDDELFEQFGYADPSFLLGTPLSSGNTKVIPSPYIGQSFQTDVEALEYYSNYGRNNGFLVRRERSKGNPGHQLGIYKRELVCHRAGPPLPTKSGEEKDSKHLRKKKPSRCKCDAQMVIKKNVTTNSISWVVVNFSNVHNHELLDRDDLQYSSGYRYISAVDRERIISLAKGGCNVNLILRSLEMEKGVKIGELSFSEKDVKNFLQASMNINPENEGSELLKSCRIMKEKNPDFRFEFTSVEVNKLEHIVWSYVGSIRAYKAFGDVVLFDTSYYLHAYNRPVGVWFGIDNNGSATFFGCVILLDEKPESYRWALQVFLRLMEGRFPKTMLTDFHIQLKDAVMTELPHTKHAFSFSQILSKLPSWFSDSLDTQFEKFRSEFCRIRDLETPEEFEHHWHQLVSEFRLSTDRHIALLSVNRSYWAVPFLRSWFFGGLLANSVLSVRSIFKGFVNSQTRLKDFIEQVGVAVDFQNQACEEANARISQQNFQIKTCLPIEEHASTILTFYAFEIFQKEVMSSAQYAVFETSRDTYLVKHHSMSDGGHTVCCGPSNEEANCSCKGFECSGILCRHILRVLSLKNCFIIPEKYLIHRWRRESSLFHRSSGNNYRTQTLRSLASIIIQESSITKNRFEYVQWYLSRLLNHIREMPETNEVALDTEADASLSAMVDVVPARSVTRGRPRKLRTHQTAKGSQAMP